MGSIGTPELMIILVIALLVFGGSKLPQLARSMGQAKTEFRKGEHEATLEEKIADKIADKGTVK
jgi:sec-independent protein translocase protein TatA